MKYTPVIPTRKGGTLNLVNPSSDNIHILDIADSISKICRFLGHIDRFYSVAEHSVNVSLVVPEKDAMVALLHDAHEAYVGDMIRPIKYPMELNMREFRELERKIQAVVLEKFCGSSKIPESVHRADDKVCATEAMEMATWNEWWMTASVANIPIIGLSHHEAWKLFLDRFEELGGVI